MVSQHPPVEATPPLVRRAGAAVLVLTGLLALASGPVDATGADTMVHPGPPTVDGATSDLAVARSARTDAMTRQATLQTELAAARAEISDLDAEQAALTRELEEARRQVRVVTVRAYTGGAGVRETNYLMDAEDAADHLYREELLSGNVVDTHEAIAEYQELRAQADSRVIELAERVDDLVAGIDQAARDIELSDELIHRAQVALSAARAATSQNSSGRTDPGEGAWSRLRFCESGGVYTTDAGNGFYGAYQFDLQTWRSMGGTGLPSSAPYWEQDLRAKALYQARGSQPWPICGRFV
jgi:Transglycosylase-like domain